MLRPAAVLIALALATPAAAFDPSAMSEDEQAAFGEAVRAYLLEHPEVLMEAIGVLEDRQAAAQAEGDVALILANSADIFEDPASFVGGNPEGDVTVVEFIDYRCGYCRKAHKDVAELISTDGNIRYVVKEFPILGQDSIVAARFAIATLHVAGPEAYARVNAGFYESFRGEVSPQTLASFAKGLGLDAEAIFKHMDTPEVTKIIEDNHRLAERLQISGTPTFVMGDQMLRGYVPLGTMRELVAQVRG